MTRRWNLMAGRWRAARWLHDDDRLTRLALICAVPIMLAYGVAGLVYGHLLMLTPAGFVEMPGACAWLAAVAAFALAAAAVHGLVVGPAPVAGDTPAMRSVLTSHTIWRPPGQPLRQVWLRTALPPEPARRRHVLPLRGALLGVALVACLSALVGAGLQSLGLNAFMQPRIALSPQAEWPLWPLPQVWRWLMPLSRDDLTLALIAAGFVLLALSGWLEHRKVRNAWTPVGVVVPLMIGVAHLGSAAYDFGVARGLAGPLQDADMVALLARDPGRHNANTFISLWTAIGCLTTVPILGYSLSRTLFAGQQP